LYFDGVDSVCDVIAALDRAVKAALAARAFAAGSWVVVSLNLRTDEVAETPFFGNNENELELLVARLLPACRQTELCPLVGEAGLISHRVKWSAYSSNIGQ
jgi:hypothetical protein